MNNLLIDRDNLSKNIIVENKSTINLINIKGKQKTTIELKDNADLTLNIFSKHSLDLNINVKLYNNSNLIINSSFINNDKHKEKININIIGSDNEVNVNARGINNGNDVIIELNGNNVKNARNNIFYEYAKVINNTNAKNILIPNLLVDNCDVTFNHGVSIGHIKDKNVFYLESKGIKRKKAIELLEHGFILSIMDEKIKDQINLSLKED